MKEIKTILSTLVLTVCAAQTLAASIPLIQNGGFESNFSGWDITEGAAIRSSDPAPYQGGKYIYGENRYFYSVWQTISLSTAGIDLTDLDKGYDTIDFGGWQASWNGQADYGLIKIFFFDEDQVGIDELQLPSVTTNHVWVHSGADSVPVPPGTRYIRYTFKGYREQGENADAFLDAAYLNYNAFFNEVTAADIVTLGAKEWAQPDLFANLSWSEINAVCPGGICGAGVLNGYDMEGWNWATVDEVNALFNRYLSARGVTGTDLMGPGPDIYPEIDAAWADDFLADGWRATLTFGNDVYIQGHTSELLSPDRSAVGKIVNFSESPADTVATNSEGFVSLPGVSIGAWFYRPLPDGDGDDVPDDADNCPSVPNEDQANTDGADDGGDACDDDDDNDNWFDVDDNSPLAVNPHQEDRDGDGRGNICDNCRLVSNPDQADTNGDGKGDACDDWPDGCF